MAENVDNDNILYKVIKWLSESRLFHICIYDTSGILSGNPALSLPSENIGHNANFCNTAKSTTQGFRYCIKCKTRSIRKASRAKEAYTAHCYLGITEIVRPVFWNNKLICIIYLGNLLLEEERKEVLDRIKRMSKLIDVDEKLLMKDLDNNVKKVDRSSLKELAEVTDIIHYTILSQAPSFKFSKEGSLHLPSDLSRKHWIIESIINYITLHYNKDLTLTLFADMHFVNPKYLSRLFKQETEINFVDYLNNVRINKAKNLIIATNESILNISAQVGFNNVTYFNKVFRKHTGITPKEFRSSTNFE